MRNRRRARAWIGVVAAYALALQALLTTVLASQMAMAGSSDPFAICLSGSDGDSPQHQPADKTHAAHEPCIICSFAVSAALSPSPVATPFERPVETAAPWRTPAAPLHLSRQRSPQIPQGPPQTA